MKKLLFFLLAICLTGMACEEKPKETGDGEKKQESQISNVSFTTCQQNQLKSSELSDKVDVKFTDKGVQITHYNFEVTCDFTTVNVTHTLVNGVLNITQKGSPNQVDCVCHSDVSYTIEGISKKEVNVIIINGKQVYCYNENNTEDIITQNFYVFSVDRDEQCGYLLFEDRGSPGLYHGNFVWAKNLPKEYQEYLLPVTVTYRIVEYGSRITEEGYYVKTDCEYPIVNIINIQKQ